LYGVGEHSLAVEWLSDEIYDADLAISDEGYRLFQKLAEENNVSDEYWRFMESGPPYRDLHTDGQPLDAERVLAKPSLESAEYLARKGKVTAAIRIYREVTGASLLDAKKAIDSWRQAGSQQGDREGGERRRPNEVS
jgi:hypothetical protein